MNSIFLIGNLTRDPDLRRTGSGTAVCTFSIAVQRRFADAQGQRPADFFNIVAWRALAENCGEYLQKGSKVAVRGALQNRSYQAQDGSKRSVTEIIADEVVFLTPRRGDAWEPPEADAPAPQDVAEVQEEAGYTDLPF